MNKSFAGMKIALIGAGISNTPLAEYFTVKGAYVTVRDRKEEKELGDERCGAVRKAGAGLVCGEGYLSDLTEELIIRSPGIRPDIPEFIAARDRGSRIITELGLFLEKSPAKIFAVTGSDGKSTTTTVISLLLERGLSGSGGKAYLGGNIGEPLLHRMDTMTSRDSAAAEISSFQLMDADFASEASVITNISPNHLNWHTDMEEYIWAKKRALRRCRRAVLNYGCGITRDIGMETDCPVVWFSRDLIGEFPEKDIAIYPKDGVITLFRHDTAPEPILPLEEILLPGMHNAENYMAAIGAVLGHVSYDDIRDVAAKFGGVRHRLELVRTINGVAYYNSSIDSSPTRTAAALSALPGKDIHLICGGYDKKIPFEPLADAVIGCGCVRTLVLTGATADKIESALLGHGDFASSGINLLREPDFDSAVLLASSCAQKGNEKKPQAVLLSPACASFDAFVNFEERGKRFCEIVNGI